MSYPGDYTFRIRQGSTFTKQFTWNVADDPVNLTGYTARMQARRSADASTTILSLTSSDYISLGGAAGTISFNIPASVTTNYESGSFVYDLELVNGATVTPLLAGQLLIDAEITR